MNKGVGLSAFEGLKAEKYTELGNSLLEKSSAELSTQLAVFQSALSNFAKEHGEEIKNNPEFRIKFSQMCTSIGIDPLSISSRSGGEKERNNWWSSSTKESKESTYELSVKVIEICRETRDANGGIISINEILKRLRSLNLYDFKEEDIIESVKALKVLGEGFSLLQINDKKFIRSVSKQLSSDQSKIFEACNILGYVSVSILRDNYEWSKIRSQSLLEDMVSSGLLWIDDQSNETQYWEPSWIDR